MITEFITYLENIKGYSHLTAVAYEKDVRAFARWMALRKPNAHWSTITRADVDKYVVAHSQAGRKPATTCRHLASLSALYKYMQREGYDVENPVKYESRPKIAKTLPTTISMQTLLTGWSKTTGELHMIITILMTTGIRLQECLDLTWDDIKWEDKKIIVRGKGNKDRQVYICEVLMNELRDVPATMTRQWKLFPMWSQRRVRSEIFWVMRQFDTNCTCSPHRIRHTYATEIAKGGANVVQLANLLGHQDIKTTQKYIDMTQCDAQAIATMYNPFNN